MATFGSAQEALLERIISEAGQSDTTPEDINYLGTTLLEIGGTLPSAPPSEMYAAQQALLNRITFIAADPAATPEEISYLGTTLQLMSATVLLNEFQAVRDNGVTLITGTANQAVFDIEKLKAETLAYIESVRLETQHVDLAVATTLGYRDATFTARDVTTTARDVTLTARDAALSSETKAKTSETNAKTSETNAAASKDRAVQAETAADTYRGAAQAARDVTLTARDATFTARDAAAASAASAAQNDPVAVLRDHKADTANPHATTAAQVGAYTKAQVDTAITSSVNSSRAAVDAILVVKADLISGKIPESQLPAIAITDTFVVSTQAAMLALTAERGDIAVRTDLNRTYSLSASPASTLANWVELRTPTDAVLSVAGKVGAVSLVKADVGLDLADNTPDALKPISAATQTALDLKAPKFQPVFDSGAQVISATLRSTGTSTSLNFETGGVVTGVLQATASAMAIGSGPGGQVLTLNDGGTMSWSGNRHRLNGVSPGLELLENDFSATVPSYLYMNGGSLRWADTSGVDRFTVNPSGRVDAANFLGSSSSNVFTGVASGGGVAFHGTASGNIGVYGSSGNNHGVYGTSASADASGVCGVSYSSVVGLLGYGGWAVYAGGPTYSSGGYQSSDERLKENIEDAVYQSSLEKLMALRVVTFDWRENTDARIHGRTNAIGMIAQEVQEVMPELVTTLIVPTMVAPPGDDTPASPRTLNQELGEVLTLDSGPLIYHLVLAVQELTRKIGA